MAAAPVQWTADVFWSYVSWVARQGREQKARLDQQKLQLQNTYSAARAANDTEKMAALQPLIHKNSVMRLRWNDLRAQFNDLVERARGFLEQAGIHEPPTLAGLGVFPAAAIAPALWVVALVAVIGLVHEINAGIKEVGDALAKIGPVGATALALAPLALIVGAVLILPRLAKARA